MRFAGLDFGYKAGVNLLPKARFLVDSAGTLSQVFELMGGVSRKPGGN